jgi:hypothetical protein
MEQCGWGTDEGERGSTVVEAVLQATDAGTDENIRENRSGSFWIQNSIAANFEPSNSHASPCVHLEALLKNEGQQAKKKKKTDLNS